MYTMDKSYEPNNDRILMEGFSNLDKQEHSTESKTVPLEDMDKLAHPSLNYQGFAFTDNAENCKGAKTFQAEGNLEDQADATTTTDNWKSVDYHAKSLQGQYAVELSYEEKEERRNLCDSEGEVTDFGIQIRGENEVQCKYIIFDTLEDFITLYYSLCHFCD